MDEQQIKTVIDTCVQRWGRIDILHNNVGMSVAGKDADLEATPGKPLPWNAVPLCQKMSTM